MGFPSRPVAWLALVVVLWPASVVLSQDAPPAPAPAAERDLTRWLSADVAAVARVRGLGARVDDLLASDLWRRLTGTAAYRAMLADEGMGELLALFARVEESTGQKPQQLVAELLGDDVVIAARPGFGLPAVTLLSRSESPEALTETVARVRKLFTDVVGQWPFRQVGRAKNIPLYGTEQLFYATHDNVLLVSSSMPDLRRCLALGHGKGESTVHDSGLYRDAGNLGPEGSLLSMAARNIDLLFQSLPEHSDDFVGSLLAGGWLEALRRSQLFTVDLRAGRKGLSLEFASMGPDLGSHLGGFAPRLPATRPSLLAQLNRGRLSGELLSGLELYRDFAAFWRRGEELVAASGLADMQEFSQTLSLVFGGKSFADEVLPQLGPTLTLVARNESYAGLGGVPQPAIPGFAAIFELRDPALFGRRFVAAMQTLVGIINIDRAQKGQADQLLLMEPEKIGDVTVYVANRTDPPTPGALLGLEDNFTPSMAVVGQRLVLSSTRELACELVPALAELPDTPAGQTGVAAPAVDRFSVDGTLLEAILTQNLKALVANRMLEAGIGMEAARQEMNAFLELLALFEDLQLASRLDGDALRIQLDLEPAASGDRPDVAPRPKRESL